MVQEHNITDYLVNCVSKGLEECVIIATPCLKAGLSHSRVNRNQLARPCGRFLLVDFV